MAFHIVLQLYRPSQSRFSVSSAHPASTHRASELSAGDETCDAFFIHTTAQIEKLCEQKRAAFGYGLLINIARNLGHVAARASCNSRTLKRSFVFEQNVMLSQRMLRKRCDSITGLFDCA